MGGARAQGIPGIMLAHWWVDTCLKVSGYRALGVLKLVSACWWGGLDLRESQGWCWPTGGQSQILESLAPEPRGPKAGVGLLVGGASS